MVVLATFLNLPFAWRRYPLSLWARTTETANSDSGQGAQDIGHADFVAALAEIDTFVDISEDDLLRIYRIATRHR